MNYIGSKFSLLSEIERVLNEGGVPVGGKALDLFAGTGVVAQLLKKRGHIVYANDWQCYSYLTNVAAIEHNSFPEFQVLLNDCYWGERINEIPVWLEFPVYSLDPQTELVYDCPAARVLAYLGRIEGRPGPFYEAYCEGGRDERLYFSKDNGLRIQAIRDQIELWRNEGLIDEKEKAWLVACLIESADRVANTASVYGAYLKRIKQSARRRMTLYALQPAGSSYDASLHRAFCEDSENLLRRLRAERFQLIYIDPPYNSRQYNANYHILETIARWDTGRFQPRGLTGLRSARENCSRYCLRREVERSFRSLFRQLQGDYVLFSYNNEGLLSKDALRALFDEFCRDVRLEEIDYRRFRADCDSENRIYKGDSTKEFLVLGKLTPSVPELKTCERSYEHESSVRQSAFSD